MPSSRSPRRCRSGKHLLEGANVEPYGKNSCRSCHNLAHKRRRAARALEWYWIQRGMLGPSFGEPMDGTTPRRRQRLAPWEVPAMH